MPNEQETIPEIRLLNSIIDEELSEENTELKEFIKNKASNLYSLIFLLETKKLDDEGIKKRIKSLIEER